MTSPEFALAIDWETSGSDFNGDSHVSYQGLSFGAAVVRISTFEIVDSLYLEIKFDGSKYKWSNEAEAIHGLTREHLESNGVDREEAAVMLAELLLKYFNPDKRMIFIGHSVDFDIAFTQQILEDHDIHIKVHPIRFDTRSFAQALLGISKSDDLFALMGFPERTGNNAMEDCIYTVESLRIIKEIFTNGLNGNA